MITTVVRTAYAAPALSRIILSVDLRSVNKRLPFYANLHSQKRKRRRGVFSIVKCFFFDNFLYQITGLTSFNTILRCGNVSINLIIIGVKQRFAYRAET